MTLLPDHFTLGYLWALQQLRYGISKTLIRTNAKTDKAYSNFRKVENGFDEGVLTALDVVEILDMDLRSNCCGRWLPSYPDRDVCPKCGEHRVAEFV